MLKRVATLAATVTAIAFLAATGPTAAGERKLSAAEIEAALAGNTVDGNWKGTPFKQYFAKGGATTYIAEGSPPSEGKWKTDPAKNQYCSWWQGSGWDCYDIFSSGPDSIIWVVPSDGHRSPSTLLSGRQL